jgi:hypothetical protein
MDFTAQMNQNSQNKQRYLDVWLSLAALGYEEDRLWTLQAGLSLRITVQFSRMTHCGMISTRTALGKGVRLEGGLFTL